MRQHRLIERQCDLFAGEVRVPFRVLDRLADFETSLSGGRDELAVFGDRVDVLASRFNVPRGFLLWQLHHPGQLRRVAAGVAPLDGVVPSWDIFEPNMVAPRRRAGSSG